MAAPFLLRQKFQGIKAGKEQRVRCVQIKIKAMEQLCWFVIPLRILLALAFVTSIAIVFSLLMRFTQEKASSKFRHVAS